MLQPAVVGGLHTAYTFRNDCADPSVDTGCRDGLFATHREPEERDHVRVHVALALEERNSGRNIEVPYQPSSISSPPLEPWPRISMSSPP